MHAKKKNIIHERKVIKMKKQQKDFILIGDLFTTFFTMTLNTLTVAFLLSNKTLYQTINLSALIISAIVSKIIVSKQTNQEKFYKRRSKLFIIESVIDIILIIPIIILGNKSIVVVGIVAILMKPVTEIQEINNTIHMTKIFTTEARLNHDLKLKQKKSIISIVAVLAGFLANKFVAPHIAYAIILLVEAINNVFYMAQKPMTGGDN